MEPGSNLKTLDQLGFGGALASGQGTETLTMSIIDRGKGKDAGNINENGYHGPERRRYANGNGNSRDWTSLRAWANAIGIVGIPGAIAIFLVYIGATQVPKLVQNQQDLKAQANQNLEKTGELIELANSLIRIAQRTCSNAAKDDNARQKCFDK